ncbi:MAG: zinc ribbon domain-containing protein [Chloroflexi bacterium]|nr:zinc ribbon domain-containing protein [Chloroflexota bacterium]
MPTYDYLCPNGDRFEVIHSVTGDGPASCPVCGAAPVRKAFSAPTIHFKGSGWAKKDRSTAARSRSASSSDTGSGGEPGSSDAPAADGDGTSDKKDGGAGPDKKATESKATESKPADKSDSAPKPTSSSKDSPPASGGSTAPD